MPINSVALANTFNEFRTTVNDVITIVNAVSDVSGVINANTLIGGTVTANNLTSGRVTLATTSGQLTDDSALTYDTATDILTLAGTTDASSSTTGTLKVAGGVGVAKKLYVGTDLAVTANTTLSGTTDASSSTTGAVIITGGVGIAKKLYVGTDLAVSGNATITGDLTVNGTTTTVNSTTLTVDDKNIELGSVATPTDVTADGGGITLKGATDKSITWSSIGWTSSEDFNLVTGKTFEINGTSVLSATTLGSGVTGSSLTSVGTIGTGVWQGTLIDPTYGGTGVNNGVKTVTLGGNLVTSGAFNTTLTATANTTVTLPTSGTLVGSADTGTVTSTMIADGTIVDGDINASAAIAVSKLASSAVTVGNTSITLGTSSTTLAGLTSVTSTSFVGALTGNASTVTTNANLTGHITSVGNAAVLGSFTSAQLLAALTDETGTGAAVFATSPTLVTPALGTPSSGVVTNLTGTASININGTVGATTATTGAFTTVTATGSIQGQASNAFKMNSNSGQYYHFDNGSGNNFMGLSAANVVDLYAGGALSATFRSTGLAVTGTVTATAFSGPLTGAVTGNASTATTLQTARAINGVSFDGSAAITVTAAAGTLSGATLASGVTASSLTSVGTISSGVWNGSSISTTYTDAKVTSIVAGTNISLSGATGAVTVNVSGTVAAATTATNQSGGTVSATTGAFSGQVTQSGDSATIHGPNSTWGAYLQVGGNGRTVSGALYASIAPTNGNLHIDSGSDKAMYLNYYGGTSGINFGSGSSSIVGTMTAAGALTMTSFSGAGTGLTGTASGLSIGGNSATVGGLTPSASSGVANRVVVADANGYIFNTYFNSSDNSVSSGVTAVMVKTGTNYLYSGTAAAIATFLSGQTMNISGSATSATSATTAGTVTTAAQPSITSVGTLTSVTTSGPIYRTVAGAGYLNGQYGSVETGSTSGAIYSIGGSYVPGTTTLGNMYGVGYTHAAQGAGTTGAPTNTWGFYAAANGVSRVYLDSENGRGWFSGDLYVNAGSLVLSAGNYNSYAPTLTGTGASGTWSISVTGNSGTVGGFTPSASSGVGNRVVVADASGYIVNSYFYTGGGGSERSASGMGYFAGFNSSDYYIRSYTPAAVATAISGQSMNISGTATGLSATLAVASGGTGVTSSTGSTSVVLSNSPSLTNPTITNYVETPYSANSSTAITLALTNGTVQIITLTGNATITMPTAVSGKSFTILLRQDATGSRTVTWSTVSWPSATAPTITTTASKMDKYVFISDGTYWYGSNAGQNYT